jgi:RNA polymerase sigma-70 factor (ECF subfamily)
VDAASTPLGLSIPQRPYPKVARGSQPWALGRNPFGIHRAILPKTRWRNSRVAPHDVFGYVPTVLTLSLPIVAGESPDTRSLLQEARAGDAEAFGELCLVHETPLLRQAMTLCGNAALAEDLAQDTLVEAWKSLRRYNGRCQFFTWLCAILLNRHRNSLRSGRSRPQAATGGGEQDELQASLGNLPDHACAPDESAQLREQAAALRACIQALPAKQQQVVYLRFYAGDSLEGIAAALGCPLGTVKSRLFHALDRLREMNLAAAEPGGRSQKTGSL